MGGQIAFAIENVPNSSPQARSAAPPSTGKLEFATGLRSLLDASGGQDAETPASSMSGSNFNQPAPETNQVQTSKGKAFPKSGSLIDAPEHRLTSTPFQQKLSPPSQTKVLPSDPQKPASASLAMKGSKTARTTDPENLPGHLKITGSPQPVRQTKASLASPVITVNPTTTAPVEALTVAAPPKPTAKDVPTLGGASSFKAAMGPDAVHESVAQASVIAADLGGLADSQASLNQQEDVPTEALH
jgi:hypothetical protein